MKPGVNTVVTNVPGPPVPIYSTGAKLVGLHGMLCLVDGVKLGHVVHSYVDEVTLAFTACRSAIPDPDFYSKCIQDSFDEHMQAMKDMAALDKAIQAKEVAKAKSSAKSTAKTKAARAKMQADKTLPKSKPAPKANGKAKRS